MFLCKFKIFYSARHWWPMPIILATREAEIRRIAIQSHIREIVLKNTQHTKKGWQSDSSDKAPA
jgi:hypothetical protein